MKNRVNFSKWLIGWTKTYMWTSFHVWSVLFMVVIKPSKWNAKCWLWCNGWNFYMHKVVRVNLWCYDGLLAANIVYTSLKWSIAPWPKRHGDKITVGTYCVDIPLLMCEILTLRCIHTACQFLFSVRCVLVIGLLFPLIKPFYTFQCRTELKLQRVVLCSGTM